MTQSERPSLAVRLTRALQEGLEAERGERNLRTHTVVIPEPPPQFDAERILRLRRERNLTRAGLATLLNVSGKTVERWEQGLRRPSGAAARFLQLLEAPEAFRACLDGVPQEAAPPKDPPGVGHAGGLG